MLEQQKLNFEGELGRGRHRFWGTTRHGARRVRRVVPVSVDQAIFLVILVVAVALLVSERLRPDIVALLIILALAWTHLLPSDQALSGLKAEPAVVIASMFVLSAGLQMTGLSELVGRTIGRLAGRALARLVAVIMPVAALASAFTHHVMITGVMMPVTLSLARERQIPASKLLMPMAIASSLGTTITILGAPSFLVSSELLRQAGRPGLGVFSIAPIGIALTVVGTVYMVLFGRFLLPARRGLEQTTELPKMSSYLSELRVLPDSPAVGRTVDEVRQDEKHPFKPLGLIRDGKRLARIGGRALEEGDVLLIRTTPDGLATLRAEPGWELEPEAQYADDGSDGEASFAPGAAAGEAEHEKVLQAVVAPRSWFTGRSVADVDFRHRYRVLVLGIWRRDRLAAEELSKIRLCEGDVLVLQGDAEALSNVAQDHNFLLLTPFEAEVRRRRKALVAGAIMVATVVAATLDWVGLGLATLSGAAAMVLSGCLTPRQAYRAVDARMYLFVAGAIPLGLAMRSTGTAEMFAGWLRQAVITWDERLILLALYLSVGLIVQFMGSDSATMALFGPIAVALALSLGHAPEAYIVTVAVAAVTAILTPMSHHNLIIYAPGGYRFLDYTRVGAPLTLLLAFATALLAPWIWSAA